MENSNLTVKDLQRVVLGHNDVLVVRFDEEHLSQDATNSIQQWLKPIFPNNEVLVVTRGTELFVIEKQV